VKGIFHSYLNAARALIGDYTGEQPFHLYLKNHFRQHAKYGGRDRRRISHLCHAYFRSGRAWADKDPESKLLASLFLCSDAEDPLLLYFRPNWAGKCGWPLREKLDHLASVGFPLAPEAVFPLYDHLSALVPDPEAFALSHLRQPSLFLRIRPGKHEHVTKVLDDNGFAYTMNVDVLTLPNGSDVTGLLVADAEVVVQDLSSQRTGEYLRRALQRKGEGAAVWDCCAASGGKSILLHDIDPSVVLTVSDVRPAILDNLHHRFKTAGIREFHAFETDMTVSMRSGRKYDIVIADVPCSGSGTWGRTPADMLSFSADKLARYVHVQRKILTNLLGSLRPGGQFVYFTCSVYRDENEEQVEHLLANSFLELDEMGLIQGYDQGADTLFAARFTLPA
jgi:16S rRNA (cytosine967-C5)-methyltransferase